MKQYIRNIFLGSLFLFTPLLKGQIVVTKQNFPSVGDTLYTAVDNLPANIPLTAAGGDQRWDFSSLQAPFSRATVVRPPEDGRGADGFSQADFMIRQAENLEAYYRSGDNALLLLGYYGTDPLQLGTEVLTRFRPPIVDRHAPLRYLDTHEESYDVSLPFSTDELPRQILDQLPITPDSLRIRIHSERADVVDAWGKMIIPGGIYDVLREKRIELRETRLDAKVGFLPWQDITDLVPNLGDLGKLTIVSHHYFSNEALEPIAVVYLNEPEEEVLRVEYKANDISTEVQTIGEMKPGVYAFPNPAIVNVRFEFSNLPAGKYTLSIFNIIGVEQWREEYFIDGGHIEKVNIAGLSKGTYLYSLTDSRGKTITTKRLLVIKP